MFIYILFYFYILIHVCLLPFDGERIAILQLLLCLINSWFQLEYIAEVSFFHLFSICRPMPTARIVSYMNQNTFVQAGECNSARAQISAVFSINCDKFALLNIEILIRILLQSYSGKCHFCGLIVLIAFAPTSYFLVDS